MSIATANGTRPVGDPEDPFSYIPTHRRVALMEAFDRLPAEAEEAFMNGDVSTMLAFLRGIGLQLLAFEISGYMPYKYSA